MEKAKDTKAKVNLQLSFYIRKIDCKCPKGYRLLVKNNKKNANWEHYNKASSKDKEKAKSHNSSSANQSHAQASKKYQKSWQRGPSGTGVNATKVAKKDKDKAKNLSHVKCYTCKQKGHYTKRCPKKLKN